MRLSTEQAVQPTYYVPLIADVQESHLRVEQGHPKKTNKAVITCKLH